MYISIHKLAIGLAISVDADNRGPLVSFLHGSNKLCFLLLRDGMAEDHQINVASGKNLKDIPTGKARHDRITGVGQTLVRLRINSGSSPTESNRYCCI